MLASFLFSFEDFVLHMPCWLHFSLGSLSYTYRPGFFFFNLGSFSCTSRAGFIFTWGVYLTHPMDPFSFFVEFLSRAAFIFIWGVSLTHPELASFLSGEFLLHIRADFFIFFCGEFLLHLPCCLHFCAVNMSDTFHAAFIFMWGVSLTHPVLASFSVGSFSHTSRVGLKKNKKKCKEFLSSAVYSEDSPLRKELGASWPRRKV